MSRLFLLLEACTTDASKLKALPELLSIFAAIKDDDHRPFLGVYENMP